MTPCRFDRIGPGRGPRLLMLLGVLALGAPAAAVEDYSLDFELQSDDVPGIDTTLRVEGEPGESLSFVADMIMSSAGLPEGEPGVGIQGWSLSVWHAALNVTALTVAGTVSALEADGGLRVAGDDDNFLRFETVDRTRNGGRRGVVMAVVLSLRRPIVLPPNTAQVVGKITYEAVVEEEPRVGFFRYEDNLVGSGQPVANVITVRGESRVPSLSGRDIVVGGADSGAVPETGDQCRDGVDNDGDTWIDELDPGCEESLGGEDCTDGVDNDGDGLIDCADASCARSGLCREICGDGLDNDGDGRFDCEDSECLGRDPCPDPEDCDDGIDNDEDGDTDCADSQCVGAPACRVRETCDDGIDNDGDGAVDCDDSECEGVAPCPGRERCRDGEDNDLDGDVDCDDSDCSAITACRTQEICGDDIDNDLDGRTDCDDRDCGDTAECGPLERCTGGVDEDSDGLVDCEDPICQAEAVCGAEEGFELVLTAAGATRVSRDLDARNVLPVVPRAGETIEIIGFVVPTPDARPEGAQGWSIGVKHDREQLVFVNASTDETDVNELFSGGFRVTEAANDSFDPRGEGDTNSDSDGFVSAVVLSFTKPITLDPSAPQSIVRARYRLTERFGANDLEPATIVFRDGMTGSGQPVNTVLTIEGQTVRPVRRIGLEVRGAEGPFFVRGDANDDGRANIADAVWILNDLFRGGPPTPCRAAADVDADGSVEIPDPVALVQYRFLDGPAPPAPFPACGIALQGEADCAAAMACR